MGLDKLNLTIYEPPNSSLLDEIGYVQERSRRDLYKYFVNLDHCQIMWQPHRFGPKGNEKMAYTKLDFSPKYFKCFEDLVDVLQSYFYTSNFIDLDRFTVSRVDVKADIEGLSLDTVLARLFVKGLRRGSFQIIRGSIYMGVDPVIKVYDKIKEIKERLKKKNIELTDWDEQVLKSEKKLIRFEVLVKRPGFTLGDLLRSSYKLVKYFDRLEFYDFEDDESILSGGGMQLLLRNTRREFRTNLDEFKSAHIKQLIQEDYFAGINKWFRINEKSLDENIPF